MNKDLLKKIIYVLCVSNFAFALNIAAQKTQVENKQINFNYSQNPKIREKPIVNDSTAEIVEVASDNESNKVEEKSVDVVEKKSENVSLASKTLEVAKRAAKKSVAPTEIYKVGVNDILFISLQNDNNSSTYYTVLEDGTIDYPLAGELVSVENLTSDEIEDLLREKIKIYNNPQISVKVREHASHEIDVLGLVENAGKKYIQREAIPLYVVRAEAIVKPEAEKVIVKRKNTETETFDLSDSKYENVLIFPGDIVEFTKTEKPVENLQFYYIGGLIKEGGQKDFHEGITLTQAILASGGASNVRADKVIIRRKNDQNLLDSSEYDLSKIKKGKMPDPILQAGDTIEILD